MFLSLRMHVVHNSDQYVMGTPLNFCQIFFDRYSCNQILPVELNILTFDKQGKLQNLSPLRGKVDLLHKEIVNKKGL